MLVSNRTNRPVDDPTIAHSLLAQWESTLAHQLWALRFGQVRDKKFCGLVAWYSAQLLVFLGAGTHIRGGFTHGYEQARTREPEGVTVITSSLSRRRLLLLSGRWRGDSKVSLLLSGQGKWAQRQHPRRVYPRV